MSLLSFPGISFLKWLPVLERIAIDRPRMIWSFSWTPFQVARPVMRSLTNSLRWETTTKTNSKRQFSSMICGPYSPQGLWYMASRSRTRTKYLWWEITTWLGQNGTMTPVNTSHGRLRLGHMTGRRAHSDEVALSWASNTSMGTDPSQPWNITLSRCIRTVRRFNPNWSNEESFSNSIVTPRMSRGCSITRATQFPRRRASPGWKATRLVVPKET